MAMAAKREFPPLLPTGFHSVTVAELRKLCVDAFPRSRTRQKIMDGLEQVLLTIDSTKLVAEAWIDGSFLTQKEHPKDSDVVVRVSSLDLAAATQSQIDVIDWLDTDLKPSLYCDSYCFIEYDKSSVHFSLGEWCRAYWIRQFGFSRKHAMKGLAVVKLPLVP